MDKKEMQVHEKQEIEQVAEPTKPEKYYVPTVDIFETEEAVHLLAEMPGVAREGVEIDLEDDTLTIRGTMSQQAVLGESLLLQEFWSGNYLRKFTVTEIIDQEGIQAKMRDGILSLTLPKVEPAKPRRIAVEPG